MSNIKVLSFDLSSRCIGVLAAYVDMDSKKPIIVKSCPIIPDRFNPKTIGFEKSKKKLPISDGTLVSTYYKKGEESISISEKKRRDRLVRRYKDVYILNLIGERLYAIVNEISPDIILVEKNEIFNGILTSILLSKILGVLIGVASSKSIPVEEIKVKTARSILDISSITKDFLSSISESDIEKIPDITKRALRYEMEKKFNRYGLNCKTDDESDACVVFNYWLTKNS